MTKEEAFKIIAEVMAQVKGSLKDHQTLQQALGTIKEALEASPKQ